MNITKIPEKVEKEDLQEMETEAGVSPIVTEKTNTGVGYTINAYYNNVK